MKNQFDYILKYYGLKLKRGLKVIDPNGRESTVMSSNGHYIYLKDLKTGKRTGPWHPTWNMTWPEGTRVKS